MVSVQIDTSLGKQLLIGNRAGGSDLNSGGSYLPGSSLDFIQWRDGGVGVGVSL